MSDAPTSNGANQTDTLPEGWELLPLKDFAEVIMGQSPQGESVNEEGDGIPFYQGVTEFTDKYLGIRTYTSTPTKIAPAGSVIFSVRAPVGQVNISLEQI